MVSASQALSTSNDNIFHLLSISLSKLRILESGGGHASRSMRTKYQICQLFVEFGRVSVNTDALLSEASKHARACVTSTVDLQRQYFNLLVISLSKLRTLELAFSQMQVVVVFTLNCSFYPTTSAAHPVSVLILYPREIQIMWSQTVRQRKNKNRE